MVKGPDCRTSPVSHDFWNSIYGPVLSRADGLAWDGTTAYAIRDANLDNNQMVEAWHAMARAGSLGAAETAIRGQLGLTWLNTVAADKDGRALYLSVPPAPNLSAERLEERSAGEECVSSCRSRWSPSNNKQKNTNKHEK